MRRRGGINIDVALVRRSQGSIHALRQEGSRHDSAGQPRRRSPCARTESHSERRRGTRPTRRQGQSVVGHTLLLRRHSPATLRSRLQHFSSNLTSSRRIRIGWNCRYVPLRWCYDTADRRVCRAEEFIKGFQVFDKEGNGFIGQGELRYVLTSLGEKLSNSEVDELLKGVKVERSVLRSLELGKLLNEFPSQ